MTLSERIVQAYQSKRESGDWVQWAETYPADEALLISAMKAASLDHA